MPASLSTALSASTSADERYKEGAIGHSRSRKVRAPVGCCLELGLEARLLVKDALAIQKDLSRAERTALAEAAEGPTATASAPASAAPAESARPGAIKRRRSGYAVRPTENQPGQRDAVMDEEGQRPKGRSRGGVLLLVPSASSRPRATAVG